MIEENNNSNHSKTISCNILDPKNKNEIVIVNSIFNNNETPNNNKLNINEDNLSKNTLKDIKDLKLNEQEILFYKNKIKNYVKPKKYSFPIDDNHQNTIKKVKSSNINNNFYENISSSMQTGLSEQSSSNQKEKISKYNKSELLIHNINNQNSFQYYKSEKLNNQSQNINKFENVDNLCYYNPSEYTVSELEPQYKQKSLKESLLKNKTPDDIYKKKEEINKIIEILNDKIKKNNKISCIEDILKIIKTEIKSRNINLNQSDLDLLIKDFKNILIIEKKKD